MLRIRYHRWKAPQDVTRTLAPYGLVLKAGRWYLVARGTGRLATYRVSQIRESRSLDEHFTRPPDFDLAAYWRAHVEGFEASRHRGAATVRISREGMNRFPDVMSDAVVRAVASTGVPDEEAGWTRAVIPTESVDHTVGELLRLGRDIEVLALTELRRRMIETIAALTHRYQPPPPTANIDRMQL